MTTKHVFLPYFRQGAAQLVSDEDFGSTIKARPRLALQVNVGTGAGDVPSELVSLQMYGPGEVLGFDSRQIIRTEPNANANDFEPNYFAFIEFDRPDFPWLFTPAKPTRDHKLRPWICLIVIPKRDDSLRIDPALPLPIVNVPSGAELPDLSESWLWAHTQVTVFASQVTDHDIRAALQNRPEANLSRLMCPRKLQPNIRYIACVVPTFEAGVLAGLGRADQVADDALLKDAWDNNAQNIQLPVYYSWEFSTGAQGDFETLARRLKSPSDGFDVDFRGRAIGLGSPGMGLPASNTPLRMEGALRSVNEIPRETAPANLTEALRILLNSTGETLTTQLPNDLPIPPPIYGTWHAASPTLSPLDMQTQGRWLHQLNLDLVYRVIADLGTQVVQEKQEDLMASAWDQLGAIEQANQILRQAQLARDASNAQYQHLLKETVLGSPFSSAEVLSLTAPVHDRVKMSGNAASIYGYINQNVIVQAGLSPAFRRFTRPRGPLGRRFTRTHPQTFRNFIRMDNLHLETRLWKARGRRGRSVQQLFRDLQMKLPTPDTDLCGVMSDLAKLALKRADNTPAVQAWQKLAQQLCEERGTQPAPPNIDLRIVGSTLKDALKPEQTIPKRIAARVQHNISEWQPSDPLEPIMVAPEFPLPVYKELARLSQGYFLPGVENVPQNSVLVLSTNRRFIEAFMVGINHEMSRELLWRGFPTDQRGSYFRQFWDVGGRVPKPKPEDAESLKDIKKIHEWQKPVALGMAGSNMGNTLDQVVLLVRGELLFRYPRTQIYMVEAEQKTNEAGQEIRVPKLLAPSEGYPTHERYPIFHGSLSPDILFFGFEVSPESAKADPGWFFVFQQPPTELRFGLHDLGEDAAQPPPTSWNDVTWAHIQQQNGFARMSLGPQGALSLPLPGSGGLLWEKMTGAAHTLPMNAAQFAHITQQDPFRIAMHASDLLR